MTPWKFRDDISNGSGVIVLTNRQKNSHTHYWQQYHPSCVGGRVVNISCNRLLLVILQNTNFSAVFSSFHAVNIIRHRQLGAKCVLLGNCKQMLRCCRIHSAVFSRLFAITTDSFYPWSVSLRGTAREVGSDGRRSQVDGMRQDVACESIMLNWDQHKQKFNKKLKPNTHRRRDSTVELSRVGSVYGIRN